jgi:hypothetical protein
MQLILSALLLLLPANPPVMTLSSDGACVTLSWDANTDPVDGYRIYWGTSPRNYQSNYDAGKATTFSIPRTFGPGQYFFTATAYLGAAESSYSNEVSMAVLPAPAAASPQFTMIAASAISTTDATIAWTTDVDCSGTVLYGTDPARLLAVVSNNLGTTDHLARIAPLTTRTHYFYKVQSICSGTTITSPIRSFNTK